MRCPPSFATRLFLCGAALAIASARLSAADQVPNPAYKQWANSKVGTCVQMEAEARTASNGPDDEAARTINNTTMTFTFKLIELTPEKAVVQMGQTIHLRGRNMDMPDHRLEIAAKIDADRAATALLTQDAKATLTDIKRGQEDVQALNKTIKCHWIEAIIARDGSSNRQKVWYSDEIPGGQVKTESTGDTHPTGHLVTLTMKLTALEQAK